MPDEVAALRTDAPLLQGLWANKIHKNMISSKCITATANAILQRDWSCANQAQSQWLQQQIITGHHNVHKCISLHIGACRKGPLCNDEPCLVVTHALLLCRGNTPAPLDDMQPAGHAMRSLKGFMPLMVIFVLSALRWQCSKGSCVTMHLRVPEQAVEESATGCWRRAEFVHQCSQQLANMAMVVGTADTLISASAALPVYSLNKLHAFRLTVAALSGYCCR